MAHSGLSPLAKGKAKAYGPLTRASPRLTPLRSQPVANPHPEALVTPSYYVLADRDGPSNTAPTPSLPPKKRLIQKAPGEGTSKATAKPIRIRSQWIAAKGGTSTNTPKERVVITLSSDSEPELRLEDTIQEVVEMDEDQEEDSEEDPEEAPQNAEVEEEEEDPKEDTEEEEEEAEEVLYGEDDYADYWVLVDSESDSENDIGDDPHLWNYDGDLSDWQNAEPSDNSSGSCTGPPPADI
ncbi:hypothetical protein PIB30_100809 [Stylosanthes scabra]|uniref:Transcription factor Iwr1 domain-containing protein n=1 Tax=Stylosanthes scabra TaxID=79078 RepID=A0ABU6VXG0_9FABA|nr:hypothetical protein [Stylosanthes scabra]